VDTLTEQSADLDRQIKAADLGVQMTKADLAATKKELAASNSALNKKLAETASWKDNACFRNKFTCGAVTVGVGGVAYTLGCLRVGNSRGQPSCVWSSGNPPSNP
jgi:hypothetical protein